MNRPIHHLKPTIRCSATDARRKGAVFQKMLIDGAFLSLVTEATASVIDRLVDCSLLFLRLPLSFTIVRTAKTISTEGTVLETIAPVEPPTLTFLIYLRMSELATSLSEHRSNAHKLKRPASKHHETLVATLSSSSDLPRSQGMQH